MRSTVLSGIAAVGSFAALSLLSGAALAQEGATSSATVNADTAAAKPAATTSSSTSTTSTTTVTKAKATVPPGTVVVHLDTPSPVTLQHRQGQDGAWLKMCDSPCDMAVPAGDEYQVVGSGMNDSKPFLLKSGEGERITLEVNPGKHGKEVAGIWLVGGGAVAAVGGAIVILVGSNGATPFPNGADGTTTHNGNTNVILVGTTLIVVGVIAAVIGGAWAIDNAHTGVGTGETKGSDTDHATSPTTPTENPSTNGSTVVSWRTPTFVEPQTAKLSAGLPTYTFPLFTKSF